MSAAAASTMPDATSSAAATIGEEKGMEAVDVVVQYVVQRWGCLVRTRRAVVEAGVGQDLARASTVPELLLTAAAAGERLRRLGAFESVSITLDAAPPGVVPVGDAVIVLVDVAEAPQSGAASGLGVFANMETISYSVEGSLRFKNLFGYCETWDASGALGLDNLLRIRQP